MPLDYFTEGEEEERRRKRRAGPPAGAGGTVPPPGAPTDDEDAPYLPTIMKEPGSPPPPRPKRTMREVVETGQLWGEEGPPGVLGGIRDALYGAFPRLGQFNERYAEKTAAAYRPTKQSPFKQPVTPGGGTGAVGITGRKPATPAGGTGAVGIGTRRAPQAAGGPGAGQGPGTPTGGAATPTAARAPGEPGVGGAESKVDWSQLGFGSQEAGENWARAFAAEHGGNLPWEEGTMSPEQNLQEHLAALQFGQQFQQTTGRAPGAGDYRAEWFRSRFGLGPNWRISGAARGGGMGYMPREYMGG